MKHFDKIITSTIKTLTALIWPGLHFHQHKNKIFKYLYLVYITYASYSTRSLLKIHVLNLYHYQNSLMRSHLSRGLFLKSGNFFAVYLRMIAKWISWAGTSHNFYFIIYYLSYGMIYYFPLHLIFWGINIQFVLHLLFWW